MAGSSSPDSESINCQPNNTANKIDKRSRTPLPWMQLSLVYFIQFAEPVTASVIYPFINQFVRETGITGGDEKKTGYFAGIIESLFFFAEAVTVVFWGIASDRFGRRPILIFGPLGLAVTMIGFGMSTKYWSLVAFRCLQGIFNGNIGVSKTVTGELTDKTNIADAFALLPLMYSVGATIGPILGGLLAQPAVRWPDTLGKIVYLKDHPYFLPCLSAGLIALLTFLGALVGLKETLPAAVLRQKQKKKLAQSRSTSSTSLLIDSDVPYYGSNETTNHQNNNNSLLDIEDNDVNEMEELRPPPLRDVVTRDVLLVLVNYGFLAFCDMCIQVLIPLMWSTSIEHGGLGFTPYTMGMTMGIFGVANAIVQANFLGPVIRKFGPRNVYIVCVSGFLVSIPCFIIEGHFARQVGHADWRVWATIVIQLCMESVNYGSYGSIQVIITGSAPSMTALGTVNGIAQAVACVMRSLGPSTASSLFAISLQRNWAGGNAVYYILLVMAACGVRLSFMLPKTLRLQ